MIEFTDGERAYHQEMRSTTKDTNGREVLVGLTAEETEFYVNYLRRRASPDRDHSPENGDRFLELHEKHELARRQVLLAENEARRDRSPRH